MAYRLVAADASPLIGLAKAGSFNLLREMFQTITVTDVVRDEVCVRNDLPGATELMQAVMPDGWKSSAKTPKRPRFSVSAPASRARSPLRKPMTVTAS